MNKIPDKIKYLIYGLCGVIFVALNFGVGEKLQIQLIENLQKMTGYFFAVSTNTLDYLAFASIPFFGMLYNSTRNKFKKSALILDIITILFSVIIIFGIGLYFLTFIGNPENPLIPQDLLIEPFSLYTTILIGYGIAIPFLCILILKLIKK